MSSSSFAAECRQGRFTDGALGPFAALIESSFSVLAREQSTRHGLLLAQMRGHVIAIETPTEQFWIVFEQDRVRLSGAAVAANVELGFAPSLVAELVQGRSTLHDALLSDRLLAQGSLQDLVAVHDGLLSYLHAGVRARGFRGLWLEFQRSFPGLDRGS